MHIVTQSHFQQMDYTMNMAAGFRLDHHGLFQYHTQIQMDPLWLSTLEADLILLHSYVI
jgi:hypothetical protein